MDWLSLRVNHGLFTSGLKTTRLLFGARSLQLVHVWFTPNWGHSQQWKTSYRWASWVWELIMGCLHHVLRQHIHFLVHGHFNWSMFCFHLIRGPKALRIHFSKMGPWKNVNMLNKHKLVDHQNLQGHQHPKGTYLISLCKGIDNPPWSTLENQTQHVTVNPATMPTQYLFLGYTQWYTKTPILIPKPYIAGLSISWDVWFSILSILMLHHSFAKSTQVSSCKCNLYT